MFYTSKVNTPYLLSISSETAGKTFFLLLYRGIKNLSIFYCLHLKRKSFVTFFAHISLTFFPFFNTVLTETNWNLLKANRQEINTISQSPIGTPNYFFTFELSLPNFPGHYLSQASFLWTGLYNEIVWKLFNVPPI